MFCITSAVAVGEERLCNATSSLMIAGEWSWEVAHMILWSLIAASGATLWQWWRTVSKFQASIINNDNRSSVLKPITG